MFTSPPGDALFRSTGASENAFPFKCSVDLKKSAQSAQSAPKEKAEPKAVFAGADYADYAVKSQLPARSLALKNPRNAQKKTPFAAKFHQRLR
ncbi:MAG: hypothetical protein JEZ11_27030 [Desulfobacterales bacterium]|nr:hypothetical protein [Desulfobacterales bacterium]